MPEGALDSLLTVQEIEFAVKVFKTQLHRHGEAVKLIIQGGRKTFAILVTIYKPEFIFSFIESDQLQKHYIDSKLPYGTKAELERIMFKAIVADFYDKQWEFTAPVFSGRSGHRCLHERIVLPFTASLPRGEVEGSFGSIYEVKLHPRNIGNPGTREPAVRPKSPARNDVEIFCGLTPLDRSW